jgi:hypothetical protein
LTTVEAMEIQELNNDQRREAINSRQRYDAWRSAREKLDQFKGSMVWTSESGSQYLVRSAYDPETGLRRQKSLGPHSPETERVKEQFESGRDNAKTRLAEVEELLDRQASINRAIGLGRMPLIAAKIIRALDAGGFLGRGIRIVGTNAIYAYEAAAGVLVEAGLTTTEDIDLLFDARSHMRLTATTPVSERNLLNILRKVDRSFERDKNAFRAVNRQGYLVDLIKPAPTPPWKTEPDTFSGQPDDDLNAAGIEGLEWLLNCPSFESVVIDERGMPLRVVVPDPRAFAIHKLWMSERPDRPAVKRRRDHGQAQVVGHIVAHYLTHLPYDGRELTSIPQHAFEKAAHLFDPRAGNNP